jgi:hypothetical protein
VMSVTSKPCSEHLLPHFRVLVERIHHVGHLLAHRGASTSARRCPGRLRRPS